jgi:hypothetical protein
MIEPIMIGCDLHERTMLLKLAQGRAEPQRITLHNNVEGRQRLIALARERAHQAGGAEVWLAYEASGLGSAWLLGGRRRRCIGGAAVAALSRANNEAIAAADL